MIGSAGGGPTRAVFPAAVADWHPVQPTDRLGAGVHEQLPCRRLRSASLPGAVGQIAYGRFRSPDYETAEKVIPPTGTLTGTPQPQGANDLIVQMFLPAVQKPARRLAGRDLRPRFR